MYKVNKSENKNFGKKRRTCHLLKTFLTAFDISSEINLILKITILCKL